MKMFRRLGLAAVGLALAACGSDKDHTFVDPYGNGNQPTFDWPAADAPLPAGALKLEPVMGIAYFDTNAGAGVPLAFKVTDGGVDVTASAAFGVREPRYGRFDKSSFVPALTASDPLGVVTVVGARVGDKVGFANLAIGQLSRTGKRRDGAVLGPAGGEPDPNKVVIAAGGGLYKADVAIVMDTTGSMGGSINDLVSSIIGKILPELRAKIPDVAFGLVEHKDYPLNPYGGTGDFPVKLHREITTDAETIRLSLASFSAAGGADLPEAQVAAMYHALTGNALSWKGGTLAKHDVPAGKLGAIGFRPGALPVVVLVTDIDWHERNHEPYGVDDVPDAITREQLADAFNGLNAKFINITQEQTGRGTEDQANWLSDQTTSSVPVSAFKGSCGEGKCCTGVSGAARDPNGPDGRCRLNFLHQSGLGVSTSLINGISGLSLGTSFDVSAKLTKAEKGPDVTKLIAAIKPVAAGDKTAGCAAHEVKDTDGDGNPDSFVSVPVTDSVCFEVQLTKNASVTAGNVPQVTWAYLDVIGSPGQVLLDRRVVMIVVPPK